MKSILKPLAILSLTILPVVAFATSNAAATANVETNITNPSAISPAEQVQAAATKGKDAEEKVSEQVREELKKFNEKKRALMQECRKKQEDLRKTLSPAAKKVLEQRKERRREYSENKY